MEEMNFVLCEELGVRLIGRWISMHVYRFVCHSKLFYHMYGIKTNEIKDKVYIFEDIIF